MITILCDLIMMPPPAGEGKIPMSPPVFWIVILLMEFVQQQQALNSPMRTKVQQFMSVMNLDMSPVFSIPPLM